MTGGTCSGCRHYVDTVNAYGGGCHGPGASIFSLKLKDWTTDRAVFVGAAHTVGLYNYQWRGRCVAPDHSCPHHQTGAEAAAAGVPLCERLELTRRTA